MRGMIRPRPEHDVRRGLTEEFPACAGMIRPTAKSARRCHGSRVPRMRGDDPAADRAKAAEQASSPHARG